MRKAVSIALFGDPNKVRDGSGVNYHVYLPTYVLAHHNIFQRDEGWRLIVHVDETTLHSSYGEMLRRMQEKRLLKVVPMGNAALTKAMLWRMSPVYGDDFDYVFCRDIDGIPMPRDRAVCDVFIASNCAVNTVHDSLSHTGIMGGLCGFQTASFKNSTQIYSLSELYKFARKTDAEWAEHGTDQIVLNRLVDRYQGPTLLEHRYNGWHAGPRKYQPRPKGEYACKAWSTPVPDKGKLTMEIEASGRFIETGFFEADTLANHLGAAGYDIVRAREFWDAYGSSDIASSVRWSEGGGL